MAIAEKKNPIERQIESVGVLWNAFAKNPEARLLRWSVDDDGVRMVNLFFDLQNEEVGEIPDLFIRFNTPFHDPRTYGFRLIDALRAQYQEIRAGIAEENIPSEWQIREPLHNESDLVAFIRCCESFQDYYKKLMLILVIVLTPEKVSNPVDWQNWLLRLAHAGLPSAIRITVMDNIHAPLLEPLSQIEPKLVHTVTPEIDMPGALEEIAETAGGVGPGRDFRKLFIALTNAAGKGDITTVQKMADKALRIVRKQKWLDMEVVVYMSLGSAWMGGKNISEALTNYRNAGRAAAQAEAAKHPAGSKLVIQTKFAEAGALFSANRYLESARIYESAAPLAEKQEDYLMTVEGWRMAAYCHEKAEEYKEAWRCGCQALDAGERLDENLRHNGTLPYVGQGLLRLVAQDRPNQKDRSNPKLESDVRRRMEALVGRDWEEKIAPGGATS